MRSFSFGPADADTIKEGLLSCLRDTTTTFEVLTMSLWRARTAVLELPPGENTRLVIIANFRGVAAATHCFLISFWLGCSALMSC